MAANTTKNKTSEIRAKELTETEKELKTKMEHAGCKEYKTVKVRIPYTMGSSDDVLFVGLNGQKFYFKRGETVNMPEPLVEILERAGQI